MHLELGGYRPEHVEVVAAFDVDRRKVGRPLHEAAFAPPNCTRVIADEIAKSEVVVQMGPVLDGVAAHMSEYKEERSFRVADEAPVDVAETLRRSGAEILLCYLPVGSTRAVHAYAEACLATGVSLVNCIPVFVVSDPAWGERFRAAGIPCAGDDIKSQVGATIFHRMVMRLFADRGVRVERTYQLNTGGNTDFLNMLSRERLASKKISKTEAVTSQLPYELPADNVHVGPSDYVPWQHDNKVCFLRVEGTRLRGRPDRARGAALGAGLAELRGHRDRRDSRGEAGARARPRRPAARRVGLQHEASAGADARRRRGAPDRGVRRGRRRCLSEPSCSRRRARGSARRRCSASSPSSARRSRCCAAACAS